MKMRREVRRQKGLSCRSRLKRCLLFCLPLFCLLLAAYAGGRAVMTVHTVYAQETSADDADADNGNAGTDRPMGQTQVSAWVEAAGDMDGNEPGENPGGAETDQDDPAERNSVRTGDLNVIWLPMLLFLAGGIVIMIQRVRKRGCL